MKFYWHIHHDVLVEPATEPIRVRRKYIREYKPKEEVELRLKLLKPVKGKLPKEVIKASEAYYKAWKAYIKAREACCKALEACDIALKKHEKEIEALHKKECPNCPWDGETIFIEEMGV